MTKRFRVFAPEIEAEIEANGLEPAEVRTVQLALRPHFPDVVPALHVAKAMRGMQHVGVDDIQTLLMLLERIDRSQTQDVAQWSKGRDKLVPRRVRILH